MNGCEVDSTMGERWEIGNYKLKRCPLKVMTQEGLEFLEAYRFYKQGQLPCGGGWMDQAQTFIEAVGIIEEEVARAEKEVQRNQPK
jgi:hypothetical protein